MLLYPGWPADLQARRVDAKKNQNWNHVQRVIGNCDSNQTKSLQPCKQLCEAVNEPACWHVYSDVNQVQCWLRSPCRHADVCLLAPNTAEDDESSLVWFCHKTPTETESITLIFIHTTCNIYHLLLTHFILNTHWYVDLVTVYHHLMDDPSCSCRFQRGWTERHERHRRRGSHTVELLVQEVKESSDMWSKTTCEVKEQVHAGAPEITGRQVTQLDRWFGC